MRPALVLLLVGAGSAWLVDSAWLVLAVQLVAVLLMAIAGTLKNWAD